MSVTIGYRIQVRNKSDEWVSYSSDVACTYPTHAEASETLTRIVARAKPGVYDGLLRILEINVTTRVVESVRSTTSVSLDTTDTSGGAS